MFDTEDKILSCDDYRHCRESPLLPLATAIIHLQNSNTTSCRPCTDPFTFESNSGLAINLALIAISVSAVSFVVATFIAAAVAAARAKKAGTEPQPPSRVPLLAHHHSSGGRGRGMSAAAGAAALARGQSKSRRSATAADLRDMYDVIDEDYIAEKEHEGGGRDGPHDASSPPVALTVNSNDDSYDIFSGQRDAENLLKILFKPPSLERDEVESRYLTVTGTESEGQRNGGGGSGRARLASMWPSSAKNRLDLHEAEMGMGSLDGRKASDLQPGSAAAAHNNLWSVRQLLREYEIRRSDPEVKRRRGSSNIFKSRRPSGCGGGPGPQSRLTRRDSEMPSPTTLAPPTATVARHHGRRRVAVSFVENGSEKTATRHNHRNSRDGAPREDDVEAEGP